MGKYTNIAMYPNINSVTGLNIRDLFGDNSLLNSKDERETKGINKSNDDILSEEELITTGINLQPETLDPLILIIPNLNSTLLSSHITAIYPKPRRPELKKVRPNANKKSNTGFHTPATNDLDLSSHNSANGSSIRNQGPKNVFTSLELVNEVSEKQKQL